LEEAIAALEAQRASLGDAAVDAAVAALRQQLAALEGVEAPPEPSAPALTGERKLVTIMFADISGFTALAETMDPEAVRDLMNACFERLVPVIEKYEGTVDKFIGDEIMALFGAPVAHENDPERALRAALDMMEALAEFNAERGTGGPTELAEGSTELAEVLGLHFGINTGLVIAGGLGTRQRQAYSVMGDAVNLAARLEDASERGEILVGPDTYRLTAPLFEYEALEPIRVKGKSEPVSVYRLLAAKPVPGPVRGIHGLESPLVGREAEFHALKEAVERLQSGVGGIVTLVGEAGLGKSRLVAELEGATHLRGALHLRLHLAWVEGRCLSYGTSIAYLLWLDVLRGLLGVTSQAPPIAVRDRLQEQTESLCPGQVETVYPYLARLMSLPLRDEDETPLRDVEGEDLKTGTFRAVESLLESATWRRPLVVVCEDLHWADPTSIELLEYLLPLTDRAPLLFLCAFRPERGHGCWALRESAARRYRYGHTDLWLEPLSPAESQTLVVNLLRAEGPHPEPVEGLPAELRGRILGHAEGNPFYVEEIIRSLMDSETIARDETTGRWRTTREVADIHIPDTLHGVLVARIDRLQEETKRILQLAAVVGRVFLYRVLAAIAQEERQIDGHLLTLQREEMIHERARTPELEYVFKHHLTQEAAYNGLLKKERRAYHRQVAEALERLFPERLEELVALLAHHWERAEEPDKAVGYLSRAGDQARLAYAHREAADYYQRALALLKAVEEYERAARTLMKLGLTYHTSLDFRRARQAYEEGFALWQRAGESRLASPSPPAPHALRMNWRDPPTLDPSMAWDSTSTAVIQQLFSGLVELRPEIHVVPDVARKWEMLEGGRKYVFHLRDDVRWSDGVPVTAGDFEYAWKRVLDPSTESPAASLLHDVRGARAFHRGEGGREDVGVRAFDRVTLVVELERPTGYFPQLLADAATFPVPQHVVEAHGQAWPEVGNLVTNGPFSLETWQRGESMVLVRAPRYHGRFTGNLGRVELHLRLGEPTAYLEMYEADYLDILNVSPLPPLDRDRARERHAGDYFSRPTLRSAYVAFDVSRPPFEDLRVRRAFVLAADKERLADVTLRGYVFPATGGFVPPGMPGHSAGIGLPYDPDQARQLLAQAGYPGGRGFPPIEALMVPSTEGEEIAEYLRTQWQENLGIDIAWQTIAWAIYLDRIRQQPPHMSSPAWTADYPDPDAFLRVGVTDIDAGWRNKTFQRLVERAGRVMDQRERLELYAQADRILVEEAAIVPMLYMRSHLLVKPWVTKHPISALEGWFWKDVIIEPH
jgi:ABC-type oligopeptide transport system substrate-binding subunit/class 3 adenylate cyclase